MPEVLPPPLQWQYRGDTIIYDDEFASSDYYTLVSHVVGLTVMSIATIDSVQISDHDNNITCRSQISTTHWTITIAGKCFQRCANTVLTMYACINFFTKGAANSPSKLSISTASEIVSLTWLAPPNGPTDCVFNYTINITNYSSSSSCYSTSNTESLILTTDNDTDTDTNDDTYLNQLTHGHNYSFAVAVTDSTGKHGPWSDQLTVTYGGMNIFVYFIINC